MRAVDAGPALAAVTGMRTIASLVLVVLLPACGFEPLDGETSAMPITLASASTSAPACDGATCLRTASATVENGLAYDGCSFPITIGPVMYAPSAASKGRVEALVTDFGKLNVSLTYRVTGQQTQVTCGWNSTQTLPEIEVVSITRAAP
jgi:hypothetical protein